MKEHILYPYLLILLAITSLTNRSFAQTITTGALSQSSVCPGGNLSVAFATTGTYNATNTFTAQLSDANGTFSATPVVVGTASVNTARTINVTIPRGTVGGTAYRIRVVSSNPARMGTNSQQALTISSPAEPGKTTPPAYCEGDASVALSASASPGGTLNWYGTNATGGTASNTAPRPNTNQIGATPYYVSQTVGGCESPRASILVTVNDKPNAPGVSAVTYCVGQTAAPLTATALAGATLNWYTASTGGTASSVAPTPSTASVGGTTYYVSQSLNGCESPRSNFTVTVSGPPAAPTATAPAPYCEGVTATALSATGQGLRWYGTAATGGTASPVATVPSTTAVGSTNYYVSQTVNGCESARTAIAVQVKDAPAAPLAAPAPSYCQSQTAVALTATASTSATLNWYGTNATGGKASATPDVPVTNVANTTNYYVSQSLNGCESPRTAIPVTVKATPGAPTVSSSVTACLSRTATALVATPSAGGTLNWYGTSATGGTPSPTATIPTTTTLGSTAYYVSQSVGGCEGARASVTVTVNAIPALPTATPPPAYCEGSQASSLSAVGQSLTWYGTAATGGAGSNVATVPSTTTLGTSTYYVTQTVRGCESERTGIPVQVKDTPNAPVTTAVDFCQGTQAPVLSASLVASAAASWYGTNATGGLASPTPPALSNATVGTTTYYVSQTLDGCQSPRASLPVRIKATPGAPGVSPASFCNNSPAQPLTATGSNGSTIKWYDATDKPLNEAPTPPTNAVGDQTYKASQTSGEGCESREKATLVVTIKPLPAAPSVTNYNYCLNQKDQPAQNVSALTAIGLNLRWYNTDGNAFPGAPTPSLERVGTQTYQVSQTINDCEGGKATIQVAINTTPIPTVAKSLYTYCINDKATPLQATAEAGGSLRWVDPYERVTNEAPTPSTLNTNVNIDGDPFYVYQVGSNGCYSARSTIRVLVNTTPSLAIVAPTANVNLGQKAPLQLKFLGSPPYNYTITGGYSGVSRTSDTTIMVLPRGATTYQVAAVTNGCGLGLPGNPATAIITVRVPTVLTSELTASTLCAGTSLTVPFTTTGEFNAGNTFLIELVNLADTTKKYDVPAAANGSPVTAPLPATLTSGQYYVRAKASNPEIGITGSNSPTVLTIRSQPTATLAGTQTVFEGVPANLTVTFGGDGPWAMTYADSVRSYSVTTTTNPLVVEVRPARTTTYRLTEVSNTCGIGTLSGAATVLVQTVLGTEPNSLDPFVKAYPIPTSSSVTIELDLALNRESANFTLTDLNGRPVLQTTTRNRRTELDLSGQPIGSYLLRIRVGDRQTVRRVLKQ